MMTVRDLIIELLDYNLDATVSINALYEESENIIFSWTCDDCDFDESKKICKHLFIETDLRNDNEELDK